MKFFVYSEGKEISDQIQFPEFDIEEIGIFESLKTYGGKIFRAKEHLKRFLDSLRTARINVSVTEDKLRYQLEAALKSFLKDRAKGRRKEQDLFLRLTLWQDQVIVLIGERKRAPEIYQKGIRLKTSPVKRSLS